MLGIGSSPAGADMLEGVIPTYRDELRTEYRGAVAELTALNPTNPGHAEARRTAILRCGEAASMLIRLV